MKILANNFLSKSALLFVSLIMIGLVISCDEHELPTAGSIKDTDPPEAGFSYASDASDFRLVNFTNLSTEALTYSWDFGAGTSTEVHPSFTFAGEGTYTVSLTATDGLGVSSTFTQDVLVEEGPYQPVIEDWGFEDDDSDGGVGEKNDGRDGWRTGLETVIQISKSPVVSGTNAAKLTGSPSDPRVGYQELIVEAETSYDVSFIYTLLESPVGALTVDILDVSAFAESKSVSPNGDTFADNGGNLETTQDFVLGSITVNNQDDSQEYVPATFSFFSEEATVVAIYFHNEGSVEARLDDFAIAVGSGAIPPSSNFSVAQSASNYLEYTFTNKSKNASSYEWDFGDGNTSTEESPTHVYSTHGAYTVKLTATADNGLTSTFTTSINILAPVTADFNYEADAGDYRTINFMDASVGAVSLLWEFGDGYQFTGMNPTHTYAADGIYEVKLTATSITGNTDEKTVSVTLSNVFVPTILAPGFEDGPIGDGTDDGEDFWRTPDGTSRPAGLGGVLQITGSPVLSGSQAAKFPTDNTRAGYQEITVEANSNYELTFWYTMKTSPVGSLTMSILDGPVSSPAEVAGATIASKTVSDQTDADTYVEEKLTFNSGSSTTVVIYMYNTDVEARVDDLSILPVEVFMPQVLNGTFDEYTANTGDNADAWDMTPNSTVVDNDGNTIDSPYLPLWNNTALNSWNDTFYGGSNEQPGSTSDGNNGTRGAKFSNPERRLYQVVEVEQGVSYTFSIDTRSEAENVNTEVFILNNEIADETGINASTSDASIDGYFNITNDFNTDKTVFTTSSFSFTASTNKIVIYVRAVLAVDSSNEVFLDNVTITQNN